jgi:hypothetical protein
VNKFLLEHAMEASVDRPVYNEAKECVYHEVELEFNTRNRCQEMLASWRPSPSLAVVLHQEMVLARAQRRQATADRIGRRGH